ncbi:cytochrome P450 [Mycolicibacterium psychrotolerans]|uniref:Steroid C26-monooxygenase n=1 Tax=Mycolicibacterium psychrotolerans TaxID=216929 RepID=A0A7I7M5K0_9MYCO|nr:cytochrome P450 [Mycolicibacterium psychrotolerans]BBX67458.1 cytochrome P450 [Mycolicibacterium psychrotolerans]
MTATVNTAADRPYDDLDISSIEFWGRAPEVRDQTFAELRAKGGVSWHPPVEAQPVPAAHAGFWAVTRNDLVVGASRDWERFSSADVSITVYDAPHEIQKSVTAFLSMDPPEHTRYRRLVSKAFTPRQLKRIDGVITAAAKRCVDALEAAGPGDFVPVVSNYMPSQVITGMIGVDDQDMREELVDLTVRLLAFGDPGIRDGVNMFEMFATTIFGLHAAANKYVALRRSKPGDDLVTALMDAEVDGERLTDEEIVSFFCALVVAGTDTTRNTITFGLKALTDFPEQRRLLLEDTPGRIDSAVVEMARWVSPVGSFVRRATRDTELGGRKITAGDRVALWYLSANRDEAVFENPWEFDILRDNAHQVAWGGGGPHYCLGANLAKLELRTLFTELLGRFPTIRSVGEPTYASSPFVSSIEHLNCEWD